MTIGRPAGVASFLGCYPCRSVVDEVYGLEGGPAVQSVMPHLAAGSIIMSERSLMNLWIEQVSVLHTGEW